MNAELFILGIVPIGLFLIGLVFLRRGLKGKRTGDSHHCRKCRYNLTGLASNTCPECGSDLSKCNAKTIGLPRRHWGILMIAALFLSGSGFLGYHGADRFITWDCVPFPIVWFLAKQDSLAAQDEINTRETNNTLSQQQIVSISEYALDQQSQSDTKPFWLLWLRHMQWNNKLNSEQEDQYYKQSQIFSFLIREKVRVGDPLPILLYSEKNHAECSKFHDSCFGDWSGTAEIMLDEKPELMLVDNAIISSSVGQLVFGNNEIIDTNTLSAGTHTLETDIKIEFWDNPDNPTAETHYSLSESFTLLPENTPDPVTWLEDEALIEVMKEHLAPPQELFFRLGSTLFEDGTGELIYKFKKPFSFAVHEESFTLDFVILQSDEVIAQNYIVFRSNDDSKYSAHAITLKSIPPEGPIDILFRGDKDSARKTHDVYKALKGEFRFNNIQLIHPKIPTTQEEDNTE